MLNSNSKNGRVGVALTDKELAIILRLAEERRLSKAEMMNIIHEEIIKDDFVKDLDKKEPSHLHHYRTTQNVKAKLENQCEKKNLTVSAVFRKYLATLED